MIRLLIFLFCMCSVLIMRSQDTAQEIVEEIQRQSTTLLEDTSLDQREQSFDSISKLLVDYLSKFPQELTRLETLDRVSYQFSLDDQIHLFTWQLYISDDEYRYGGVLFLPRRGVFYVLDDYSDELDEDYLAYETLASDRWLGALYYDVQRLTDGVYLLFGYDAYQMMEKRKYIEVLDIRTDRPIFGSSIFGSESESRRNYKKRFILDFSAEAPATLRYERVHDVIVFDHMVTISRNSDLRSVPLSVPSGLLSGFTLDRDNGLCYWQEDILPYLKKE